jgi:hypothetical protein
MFSIWPFGLFGAKQSLHPPTIADKLPESRSLQYEPLDEDNTETRMLSLLPERPDGGIHCTLEKISLINPGKYVALSYHWGDPKITTPITVNNVQVNVTVNLGDALRQLRSRPTLRIWVDALCINQADLPERSRQLRSMTQIYSKASEVVAWVGSASKDSETVLHHLKHSPVSERVPPMVRRRPSYIPNTNLRLRRERQSVSFQMFDDFFDRPYWRRVWIIQEVAVASKLRIQCGPQTISWDELAFANDIYAKFASQAPQCGQSFSYVKQISTFRHKVQHNEKISLIEAIRDSQKALSRDPRDRVFALLGICHDGHALVPMPNYKQSMEEILRDMTKAMIKASKSLDILLLRSPGRADTGKSPCWVPDWLGIWPEGRVAQYINATGEPLKNFWVEDLATNSDIFRIRGEIIGTIVGLSSTPDLSSNATELVRHLDTRSDISNSSQRYYGTASNLIDAIWKSMCMDLYEEKDLKAYRKSFSSLWATKTEFPESISQLGLGPWLDCNATFCIDDKSLMQWSQFNQKKSFWNGLRNPRSHEPAEDNFIAAIAAVIVHDSMRLIVTNKGQIGMAHPQTLVGDIVCDIPGFSSPVVLRKSKVGESIQYYIVGEANVGLFEGGQRFEVYEFDSWVRRRGFRGDDRPMRPGGQVFDLR